MQFKVPQFLDIEDKIFGPLTFKEFVYLAGGAGACFVLYKLLGVWLGAIPILIVASLSLTLTFYRPNNKPFVEMLQAFVRYAMQSKLYIWEKKKGEKGAANILGKGKEVPSSSERVGARLSGSRLRDLAWSLDVLDLEKVGKSQK